MAAAKHNSDEDDRLPPTYPDNDIGPAKDQSQGEQACHDKTNPVGYMLAAVHLVPLAHDVSGEFRILLRELSQLGNIIGLIMQGIDADIQRQR